MDEKHYVITYGGISTEHDISVITALQVYAQSRQQLGEASIDLVYQTRDGKWFMGEGLTSLKEYKNFDERKYKEVAFLPGDDCIYLKKKNKYKKLFHVDYLLNAFHGGAGEDGEFVGILEGAKIVSSSATGKALSVCMDKYLTKCECLAASVPVVDFFIITKHEWINYNSKVIHSLNQFDYPVVVKPASQGSSIGVALATCYPEFEKAINLAFNYDDTLIIERAILNKREFNVIAARVEEGKIITKIEEPEAESVIITFSDKYLAGEAGGALKNKKSKGARILSAGMASQAKKEEVCIKTKERTFLHKNTRLLYDTIGLNGIVRFDYMMDTKSGQIYLGEVNAVPGSLGLYFFEPEDNILPRVMEASYNYWQNEFNKTKIVLAPTIFSGK